MDFDYNKVNKVRKYCHSHCKKIDLKDTDMVWFFEYYILKIVPYLFDNQQMTSKDIETILQYVLASEIKSYNLPAFYQIKSAFYSNDEYMRTFTANKVTSNSRGICLANGGMAGICINKMIVEESLKDGRFDCERFYSALKTVCHEPTHASQTFHVFHDNKTPDLDLLIIKKEYIICKVFPDYHKKNKNNLLLEKQTRYNATLSARQILIDYFPYVYQRIKRLVDDDATWCQKERRPSNIELDDLIATIVENEYYDVYPILGVEYNKDNTRKNHSQLSKEYDMAVNTLYGEYNRGKFDRDELEKREKALERLYDKLFHQAINISNNSFGPRYWHTIDKDEKKDKK